MYLLLATLLVGAFLAVLFRKHRRRYRFAQHWPEMKPVYPLVGNGPIMLGKSDSDKFDVMSEVYGRSDRLIKLWAGPKLLLCTSHPDLIRLLLHNEHCMERPFMYNFLGFYQGLFAAKYHHWHDLRKRIDPAFNYRTLSQYVPIYAKCAHRMVQSLEKCSNGTTVNILDYTGLCLLDMSCAATLGIDMFEIENKDEIIRNLEITFSNPSKRMSNIFLYPDFIYRLTKFHAEEARARKIIVEFFIKVLKAQTDLLAQQRKHKEHLVEGSQKPTTFIDQLLDMETSNGDAFNQTEISDNIGAIMSAASDTCSQHIAHACLFLAFYKDIQEKLFQEIITILPTTSQPDSKVPFDLSPETIAKLTYMDRFVKECLRLAPPGPSIARENMTEITVDGVKVPPGNVFIISLYSLHRRKDIWGPDADQFDPDRFSDERSAGRHSYAFLPFSAGRRNCIGWRQGMILTKVVLIYLIRNFKLDTHIRPDELRYKYDMILRLAFPYSVQLTKRI